MKKVLRIVVAIFVLVGFLYLLEKLYDFGLKHNQNLKLSAVTITPPCASLLIHGPCEPLWMLSPALLDPITGISSYNLALSHSDFADNFLHLYLYLKQNKAPGYLLLYITPESLDRHYNTFNSYRFAPYLSDSLVSKVVEENDPDYYQWTFIPFMKYAYYNNRFTFDVIQGYKHYFTGRKKAYYPDGFEPPAKITWANHGGDFADLYDKQVIFETDELREKYLLETLRLAKARHIKVLLYESPVLAESLPFQRNRPQMLAKIQAIAAGENVPFISFENLPLAEQKKYFISTLNLNMEGLELFNDTLGKFIRQRILQR